MHGTLQEEHICLNMCGMLVEMNFQSQVMEASCAMLKGLAMGWGCNSAVEHLPSVHTALSLVPSTEEAERKACGLY